MEKLIQKSGLRKQDESETAQGYYAFSAAGDFYASANTHDPDEVLALLAGAKSAFVAHPPAKIELNETSLGPEARVPEGALILRVYCRITPLPAGLSDLQRTRNGQLGRDHLWMLKEEAAEILASLKNRNEMEAPPSLSRRLCRFHLTDNVRGESDLWEPDHLKKSALRVAKIGETETVVRVTLSGTYSMLRTGVKVEGRDRKSDLGLEGTLEGVLEIDKTKGSWKDAKVHATATAWGASTFTPDEPPGRFPVQIGMIVTTDVVSRQIAPQGVMNSGREAYLKPE
jgi:hypothetical protein